MGIRNTTINLFYTYVSFVHRAAAILAQVSGVALTSGVTKIKESIDYYTQYNY